MLNKGRKGRTHFCHQNARKEYFHLKRLGVPVKYVEGEVFAPLEYGDKDWINHAWLLIDGEIYDPTYGENDYEYKGRIVKDEYMKILPEWFHKMLAQYGGVEEEDLEEANIRVTDKGNFGKKAFENVITNFKIFENQEKKIFTNDEIAQMYKDDNRRLPFDVKQALDEYKLWKLILINPNAIDTTKDEAELYEKDPQNVDWYEKNIRGRMEKEGDNFPILIEYRYKSPKDEWHYKRNALYPKPLDGWHRFIAAKKLGLKKIKALIPIDN